MRIKKAGFTRIELLAVTTVIGLLLMLVSPAVGGNDSSKATQCLNNLKQLTAAWLMYSEDNSGVLVENYHGGEAQRGSAANDPRKAPWALGWLDFTTSPDNTNELYILDAKYARLSRYLTKSPRLFQCPADVYISKAQAARGWSQRSRSVALNGTLGNGNAQVGPWDTLYVSARKLNELLIPGPVDTFVFLDEHADSINDPLFFPPRATTWVDTPANYHNGAGSFSFADGRVELHSWVGNLRQLPVRFAPNSVSEPPGSADMSWVSYRSVRRTEKSY